MNNQINYNPNSPDFTYLRIIYWVNRINISFNNDYFPVQMN